MCVKVDNYGVVTIIPMMCFNGADADDLFGDVNLFSERLRWSVRFQFGSVRKYKATETDLPQRCYIAL